VRIISSNRIIRKGLTVVLLALASMVLTIGPTSAITFGQPDGNRHPNVGALLADYDPDSPGPDIICSGTLIAPTVFLTAAHCTAFLEAEGISQVWVSFVPAYDEDSTSLAGLVAASSFVGNPEFGSGGASDTHDIAVVLLRQAPAGITPARLPTAGLLDQLKASHQLDEQTFTAVGYGTVREDKTGGPHSLFFDGVRRYALQHALNLEKAWLLLSMNPPPAAVGPATATRAARTSWAGCRAIWSCRSPSPVMRGVGPATRPTGRTRRPPETSSTTSSPSP
jgi:hypothetical protein